jgi:hypothetical protein
VPILDAALVVVGELNLDTHGHQLLIFEPVVYFALHDR